MSDHFAPRVGGVLSADIAVPQHEREMRFYSRVLTTGETPFWREDLMNNQAPPSLAWARPARSMATFRCNGCHIFRLLMSPPV